MSCAGRGPGQARLVHRKHSDSLNALTGASPLRSRQRFEATDASFHPVSFVPLLLDPETSGTK